MGWEQWRSNVTYYQFDALNLPCPFVSLSLVLSLPLPRSLSLSLSLSLSIQLDTYIQTYCTNILTHNKYINKCLTFREKFGGKGSGPG